MQFHIIVNLDKRQFLAPEAFGEGRTILEFARGSSLMLTALAWLLAEDNGRGQGDAPTHPRVGSWARNCVVLAGDYGDDNPPGGEDLYTCARANFENVSADALAMLGRDRDLRQRIVDLGRGDLLRKAEQ